MNEQYMVFAYPTYFPQGGMNDCLSQLYELEDAQKCIYELDPYVYQNAHIVSYHSREIVQEYFVKFIFGGGAEWILDQAVTTTRKDND